jgi:protein O-GlcNAc transferase
MSQLTVDQAIQLALQHQRANQLAEAESIFRQILSVYPDQPDALHLLGGLYLQAKQTEQAEAQVRKAIALRPEPSFFLTLGVILQQQKRYEDALLVYKDALAHRPDHADTFVHQGVVLSLLGRFEESAKSFQEALRLAPGHAQAQGNLGIVLVHLKRYEEAAWILRAAIARVPKSADFHASLGAALQCTGQTDAALLECREALNLDPAHVQALNLTSHILRTTGRVRDAVEPARQAAALLPDFPDVQINCGESLREAGLMDEAVEHYERVLARKLETGDMYNNLGNVYKDQGRLDEAMAQYRRALALQLSPIFLSNLVYSMHYHPGFTPEGIFKELRHYDETFVRPFKGAIRPLDNDRNPERRLRIGYLSTEFRQHALGLYLTPLLENHDKSRVEVFCYADVTKPDFYTFRHRQCADAWRDTHGLPDDAIADLIRKDRIDILIDLHQHMGGNRLLVYARRPAPVQMGYAGYPNTSGVSTIDYRLTDPWLEPANEPAFPTSETVLHLPHTWWCYHAVTDVPVNSLPARETGRVTFGNLNNFCKLNEETYQLWAQVMRVLEKSRLLLLAPEGSHRARAIAYLGKQGVAADRITFLKRAGSADYYKYYHQIDLCLDSFPYNGHTTSLDSFYMGVPVTSYVGPTPWGRGTWSQASNLGLPELVGKTPQEFVKISIALAQDLARLAEIRATLRERMRASPLLDGPGFARAIEAAYRYAWRQYCKTVPVA